MAEALAPLELEFRIALLPPISRGAHLAGPKLHADRLVKLWEVVDGDSVPLAQAWRLLEPEAVAEAIWRTLGADADGYRGDPRHWVFPPLVDLLPELQQDAWQALLAGELELEAIRGIRGKGYYKISPLELPRLAPDWELSRLARGDVDVLLEARVRRRSTEPVKGNWREPISKDELRIAAEAIAKKCAPGERLSAPEFWSRLKDQTKRPDLPRKVARDAFDYVPQLKIPPGYHPPKPD
jgi:hypothetical protein